MKRVVCFLISIIVGVAAFMAAAPISHAADGAKNGPATRTYISFYASPLTQASFTLDFYYTNDTHITRVATLAVGEGKGINSPVAKLLEFSQAQLSYIDWSRGLRIHLTSSTPNATGSYKVDTSTPSYSYTGDFVYSDGNATAMSIDIYFSFASCPSGFLVYLYSGVTPTPTPTPTPIATPTPFPTVEPIPESSPYDIGLPTSFDDTNSGELMVIVPPLQAPSLMLAPFFTVFFYIFGALGVSYIVFLIYLGLTKRLLKG